MKSLLTAPPRSRLSGTKAQWPILRKCFYARVSAKKYEKVALLHSFLHLRPHERNFTITQFFKRFCSCVSAKICEKIYSSNPWVNLSVFQFLLSTEVPGVLISSLVVVDVVSTVVSNYPYFKGFILGCYSHKNLNSWKITRFHLRRTHAINFEEQGQCFSQVQLRITNPTHFYDLFEELATDLILIPRNF